MKKLIPIVAALALPAVALPAAAQDWSQWNTKRQNPTGFVDGLQWRISQARQSGRISPGQAHRLMQREIQAKPIAWRVQTGTASWRDRQRLNQDVDVIENTLTRSYHTYRGYRREEGWTSGWGGNGRPR